MDSHRQLSTLTHEQVVVWWPKTYWETTLQGDRRCYHCVSCFVPILAEQSVTQMITKIVDAVPCQVTADA